VQDAVLRDLQVDSQKVQIDVHDVHDDVRGSVRISPWNKMGKNFTLDRTVRRRIAQLLTVAGTVPRLGLDFGYIQGNTFFTLRD
jgi:hypothetical protein